MENPLGNEVLSVGYLIYSSKAKNAEEVPVKQMQHPLAVDALSLCFVSSSRLLRSLSLSFCLIFLLFFI